MAQVRISVHIESINSFFNSSEKKSDYIMSLRIRDTQTQVKHKILKEYLGAWSGIIRKGLENVARRYAPREYRTHFVYVDCFSYIGLYAGDQHDLWLERREGAVAGSPIIGITALDSIATSQPNLTITVNAILFENDASRYRELLANLCSWGYEARIRETDDFESLLPGEIAVINDDCTAYRQQLMQYVAPKYTKAFFFVDPYGPTGIPYDFVKALVQGPGNDVMINFIYSDLQRKSGAIETRDWTEHSLSKHVEHWSNAFGSDEWIDIVQQIDNVRSDRNVLAQALGLTKDEAAVDPLFEYLAIDRAITDQELSNLKERRLVDLYQSVLRQMDSDLAIKVLRLRFPDKERTMFYLLLTTHDGTGALALNEILFNAEIWENDLRYIRWHAKRQLPQQGQMRLLPPEMPEVPNIDKSQLRPSPDECQSALEQRFTGKTVTRREVYKAMADDIFFAKEIDKALASLKKQARVSYDNPLRNDTEIAFR